MRGFVCHDLIASMTMIARMMSDVIKASVSLLFVAAMRIVMEAVPV